MICPTGAAKYFWPEGWTAGATHPQRSVDEGFSDAPIGAMNSDPAGRAQ
jgi:hypothetical protein